MSRENLEQYTYDYLMQLALSFVREDIDKREGSIIYDALAPFCQILAAGVLELKQYYEQTYAVTATGQDLDNRVAEQGMSRYAATYAVKLVEFRDEAGKYATVPIGSRFSTISDTRPVNYTITAPCRDGDVIYEGRYEATCDEPGAIGNDYFGNLVAVTHIQGLSSASMHGSVVYARDEETDDELRKRYFNTLNQKAFCGNIADYRSAVGQLPEVGAVQVYPVWAGGGTVKLSIVDKDYNVCSSIDLMQVKSLVDPHGAETSGGEGLGIAPIGHFVTVTTPEEVVVNVEVTIDLQRGYDPGQVEGPIKEALQNYVLNLRKTWAEPVDHLNKYVCDVYSARVSSTVLGVTGVANVSNILLNGSGSDIRLEQTGTRQQIPKLGEVTIHV